MQLKPNKMLKMQQKAIFFRLLFGKSAFLYYLCTCDSVKATMQYRHKRRWMHPESGVSIIHSANILLFCVPSKYI